MNIAPRSDLLANREDKRRYKQRLHNEPFGVYRPLTPECFSEVREVLADAKEEINDFLAYNRSNSANMPVPEDLGVTFVRRLNVQRSMRRGLLHRGFDYGNFVRTINERDDFKDEELKLPLRQIDWYSSHRRKLVGRFVISETFSQFDSPDEAGLSYEFDDDYSESLAILDKEASTIRDSLDEVRARDIRVHHPDHISFYKYGRQGDCLDLRSSHRKEISGIVKHHFEDANLLSITLGGLVIGDTYSRPHQTTA